MKRRRVLDELDADIRDHIERETADNIDRGMTPDDARAAALRKFGNISLAREDARAVWIPVWFDQLLQDARYGLRMIRRRPAFSAVVMLSHAFFERWFRGDPGVVGRSVALNGRPTIVTGVLPRGFRVQLPPPPAFTGVQSGEVDLYRTSIVQPPGPPGPMAAVQLFNVIG